MRLLYCFTALLFAAFAGKAQPFTKNYIMSFHTCDASCNGFQDHMVHLAESNDGITWTLVPNFVPYTGSVPDVIVRGTKVYIFTPGMVKRYDHTTGLWENNPQPVSIVDSNNVPVSFVDPSAIVDSNGNLVLFFLNATGLSGDPAGCSSYPCTKYFDSATEVPGSDGTQFVMNAGHRASVTLNSSPQTASDPDIYFDGSSYQLYISSGPSTLAAHSASLHGPYALYALPNNGTLIQNGGVPCGMYDTQASTYRTYAHAANMSSAAEIRMFTHSSFASQLSTYTTVISGPIIGEPVTTKTESPGICNNTLLTLDIAALQPATLTCRVFPNPVVTGSQQITIALDVPANTFTANLYDVSGQLLYSETFAGQQAVAAGLHPAPGVYILEVVAGEKRAYRKIVWQ